MAGWLIIDAIYNSSISSMQTKINNQEEDEQHADNFYYHLLWKKSLDGFDLILIQYHFGFSMEIFVDRPHVLVVGRHGDVARNKQ